VGLAIVEVCNMVGAVHHGGRVSCTHQDSFPQQSLGDLQVKREG
jgi:phosphate/sulfate permease